LGAMLFLPVHARASRAGPAPTTTMRLQPPTPTSVGAPPGRDAFPVCTRKSIAGRARSYNHDAATTTDAHLCRSAPWARCFSCLHTQEHRGQGPLLQPRSGCTIDAAPVGAPPGRDAFPVRTRKSIAGRARSYSREPSAPSTPHPRRRLPRLVSAGIITFVITPSEASSCTPSN
jgi:hypothetical protein